MTPYSVIFVCMGNICRSPTADGVLRHKLRERAIQGWVTVDSAGTHNYHPHSPPDARSQRHVDSVNQHGRSSDNHLGRFRGMNVAG